MVAHYLVQGYTRKEIKDSCTATWNCTPKTVDNYIRSAYGQLKESLSENLEEQMGWHRSVRLRMFRERLSFRAKVLKDASMSTYEKSLALTRVDKSIDNVISDMARLDGLYVERTELTGANGAALFPENMTINFVSSGNNPFTSEEQIEKIIGNHGSDGA